jgi:hypothetical protein
MSAAAESTAPAIAMQVTSRDGTRIACERVGDGPAVILVDGAIGFRNGAHGADGAGGGGDR